MLFSLISFLQFFIQLKKIFLTDWIFSNIVFSFFLFLISFTNCIIFKFIPNTSALSWPIKSDVRVCMLNEKGTFSQYKYVVYSETYMMRNAVYTLYVFIIWFCNKWIFPLKIVFCHLLVPGNKANVIHLCWTPSSTCLFSFAENRLWWHHWLLSKGRCLWCLQWKWRLL